MEFVTHDEAILVEIRPARLPQQLELAKHLQRLAFTLEQLARRPGAFAIGPVTTGRRPSPRLQRRRGMRAPSDPAQARLAPAPFLQSQDPEFFPPPAKQPLPPGKQPTGPMPDQDPPPIQPHHLPDDPVATPEQGDLLAWTPKALGEAALGARIPL
jgi:hypothetical protein